MSERAFSQTRRRVLGAHRQGDCEAALRIAEEAAIEPAPPWRRLCPPTRSFARRSSLRPALSWFCSTAVASSLRTSVTPSAGWALRLLESGELRAQGIRGHLTTGSLDPRRDDCQRLAQQLRENGAEVQLDVIEGLDHEYPPDFDHRLPEAMAWVLQGGK